MNNQDFGKFISTLRKEKGITQIELAEKINVSDKAISRWENGKNYPDIEILEALAKELGASISELIACKKIETPNQAEVETAKAYIIESNKVKKMKNFVVTLIIIILVIATILVVPTSFCTHEGGNYKGTMEMQSLTYKIVKWNMEIGEGVYNHTSWYFFDDSKTAVEELWKHQKFDLYYNDKPYTGDIGAVNIGAEMPEILYMDYKIVVFYGGSCGLVIYDYVDDVIKKRIDTDLLKNLGFDLAYATMDTENRIVYFEQDPFNENDVLPLSYSMDSMMLSRIDAVPRIFNDVRIQELDEQTRIEYEIKKRCVPSFVCFNDYGMKAFLIADNDWSMESLKLVIIKDGATTEYKIFK